MLESVKLQIRRELSDILWGKRVTKGENMAWLHLGKYYLAGGTMVEPPASTWLVAPSGLT